MGDRDFVVLPRDALFEFFGEVALPPFPPNEGRDLDCAVFAQRITEWVDEHDLSDVHIGAPRLPSDADACLTGGCDVQGPWGSCTRCGNYPDYGSKGPPDARP